MSQWALRAEENNRHKWKWPSRRVPTSQNMKVWRDYLRGTFMKGIDDILVPITTEVDNIRDQIAHPLFDHSTMVKKDSLQNTLVNYPHELLDILGQTNITDEESLSMMTHLGKKRLALVVTYQSKMTMGDIIFV